MRPSPLRFGRRAGLACAAALATVSVAAGTPSPAPMYGAHGLDLQAGDPASAPGDGFYRYANGAWMDRAVVPPDQVSVSLRRTISDLNDQRLKAILEAAAKASAAETEPSSDVGKVGAFYRAAMDEARIEALGGAPLGPSLAAVRTASTRDALARLMGHHVDDIYGAFFQLAIVPDAQDPGRYAVRLGQAGLGLPDRDFYLRPEFGDRLAAYQAYVAQLLAQAGWPLAEARARDVVALERRIAEVSWRSADRRDPLRTHTPRSVAELEATAPGFPWRAFLDAVGLSSTRRVVVAEDSAVTRIAAIFASAPAETLQAWMAFQLADHAAPDLSHAFADPWFAFRRRVMAGQAEPTPRWRRAVQAVAGGDYTSGDRLDRFGNLGWTVGELYVAQAFTPGTRAKVTALTAELKSAFRRRLQGSSWMAPSTRAEALRKLDSFRIEVGYPTVRRDISRVRIRDDDLLGDVRRSAQADWAVLAARAGGPVDRKAWEMTPQTNDAYNAAVVNVVVFPAGILQAPIFDPAADPAVNYGGMGAVIGHELTHGFDDQGRHYDALGLLRDWWSPADSAAFEARAAVLAAQYDAFEPLPGAHVDGRLTLGENIADLGGLAIALDAYHASLNGRAAPLVDGLTGDQRVFLGWAQIWRGKMRSQTVRAALLSDPHAPRDARVDGVVRNLDAWYAAFRVRPGQRLYLPPTSRVRIW